MNTETISVAQWRAPTCFQDALMPGDYKGRRELKTCLIGVSSHPLMWLKNIPATCERLWGCSFIYVRGCLQFVVVVI